VLAAAPATPVQLSHACIGAGFDAVIPASWGDELIASRAIDRLRAADAPLVQCSCPYVARRLAVHGDAIASLLLSFVSPPVATAQYLRAAYAPARPRITYAGGCPSASHDSIDVWLSVDELMNTLSERGVPASAQPTEFDSVIPPDRRRYFSDPGGVPSRSALRQLPTPVELVELQSSDMVIDVAQQLLSRERALIDLSLSLGCCCSGVVGPTSADGARARVREHEPPRALSPVVDHALRIALETPPPQADQSMNATVDPPTALPAPRPPRSPETTPEPALVSADAVPRRRSPAGLARPVLGAMPLRRAETGRQLPRAYVARRRSSPRGFRESTVRREAPTGTRARSRAPWMWVAATGTVIAVALGIALLLLLTR